MSETVSKMENVGDFISRQAAIDAIHEDADWLAAQGSDWQVERMERDKSILKSLPTVQQKRGKWDCTDDIYETAECSCCKWDSGEAWDYAWANFSFCPNCGAKMER